MAEIYDNQAMNGQPVVPLVRMLKAPFTRRAWAELAYALATVPLAAVSVAFALPTLYNGILWPVSAPVVRKLAAAHRFLAWRLLGERVPAPSPLRGIPLVRVRTADAARFSGIVENSGGRVRQWAFNYGRGITVAGLSPSRIAELATAEHVVIVDTQVSGPSRSWIYAAARDRVAWRARVYFAAKLPLAALSVAVVAGCWLGGLYFLTFPAWWALGLRAGTGPGLDGSFAFIPLGAAMFLAAPWLLRGTTEPDRWLIRSLLGPASATERIRALEETRAHAVDDSAARLRSIERNLHDGTQAQLVGIAMKLGLAKEKLAGAAPVDLARLTQLVEDAHTGAIEAIAELRTLARGIHPPVLDKGLADALATLAARSAVPVELVTEIPERPTDAIETIAYFSAAELLTNVAKHSGARHATLEAVHVPGMLRIRVTDDGHGGARPVTDGGLRGLAERVRTVDGHLGVDSPRGGPTIVTVELPSHA
jgi:signal transduction histidine kinase